jgi:hypothetical protein
VVDGELRKEDLVWSEHEVNDGDRENRRVLRKALGVKLEMRTMGYQYHRVSIDFMGLTSQKVGI